MNHLLIGFYVLFPERSDESSVVFVRSILGAYLLSAQLIRSSRYHVRQVALFRSEPQKKVNGITGFLLMDTILVNAIPSFPSELTALSVDIGVLDSK